MVKISYYWRFKKYLFYFICKCSNYIFGKDVTNRFKIVRLLNEARMYIIEHLDIPRRRLAKFEKEHPELPWFVPESIAYIESLLQPSFVGFEWGSGRSTIWMAKKVYKLTSVEGRNDWYQKVQVMLKAEGLESKINLKLSVVTGNYNFSQSEIDKYVSCIDTIPDASLDFVIVDGHFREACLDKCFSKICCGGFLVLDNSDLPQFKCYHKLLSNNHSKTFNNGVSETTVFHASEQGGFFVNK